MKTLMDRIAMWYLILSGLLVFAQMVRYMRDNPAAIAIFVWIIFTFVFAYWLGGRIDAGKHPDPQ